MLNKNELEKLVINFPEELKPFEGHNLANKHLILNTPEKNIKFGALSNCIIEGETVICEKLAGCHLENMKYVYADEIYLSSMQRCKAVQCGGFDDDFGIEGSWFSDCEEISINESTVTACIFHRFKTLSLVSTSMDNCRVYDVLCDGECAISMEDGEMTNVVFEDIELKNDSYLIEGYGEPWVESCVFANIHTSRDDCELFHMEETRGKIFKTTKEYCFVDEESCSGLDSKSIRIGMPDLKLWEDGNV